VRGGALADRAFESAAAFLEESDRRLAQELSYGVLRLRGRLDYVIDAVVAGGAERLEPEVLDILRLGAYQLLELDRVPPYAAVSEAVEAAKRASGKGAAGLANAVLRRLSEGSWDSFGFPRAEVDPLGYLTVWGSHPRWLVERWLGRWSFEDVERLVSYNNRRPGVFLSVIGPRESALETLRAGGVEADPVPGAATSVRIEPRALMAALDRVQAVVQDPGAAAVVEYMALDPGSKVVDLCAAPGGKAALLSGRGHDVWAFDVSAARLARLLENRTRLGLSRLHVARADARRPPLAQAGVVLLDVPCSGTGTLGRHPDGRWRIQADGLAALVALQRCLLDGAAEVVGPGGLLVYATCSLESEENEEQVKAFLARHTEFELERVRGSRVGEELLDSDGTLRVLPQRHDMDGAYAARLRRRSV
jgi:16S rRNA (cytosine967-C5)-methyltransferase